MMSDNSFGFRPHRSAQNAMMRTLDHLNEGYEWVIDLDIEAYFDTVNHDKLISILRERVFDSATLHLIRKFLQAGIMEKGLVKSNTLGMPQGQSSHEVRHIVVRKKIVSKGQCHQDKGGATNKQ